MSAEPVEPGRSPFVDASPARVRGALTPEDAAVFDRHWRSVMQGATERLDLAEVYEALDEWRRVASVTSAHGVEAYREAMAFAESRLHTGERVAGAVPWAQVKGGARSDGLTSPAGGVFVWAWLQQVLSSTGSTAPGEWWQRADRGDRPRHRQGRG